MKTLLVLFIFFPMWLIAQAPINACMQLDSNVVVVIGSSTAAGTGPSVRDSAWVNRYRAYAQQISPNNQVINLAIGGTTTYHIMPDWFVPAAGKPATNPNNNISEAIRLGADAIIVNMPSNDAAFGFTPAEQMTNFRLLEAVADSAGIPIWICTTQPRNFSNTQKNIQLAVRDSILNVFGPFAINFWSGTASNNNDILPQYDSGDGVHMNNAGHRLLVNRVIAEDILALIADTATFSDQGMVHLAADSTSICGDSSQRIQLVVGNTGVRLGKQSTIHFSIQNLQNGMTTDSVFVLIDTLEACQLDTIDFFLNTTEATQLRIQAYFDSLDVITSNDTSQTISIFTKGHPFIDVQHDTVCLGDSSTLRANGAIGDTILWYDAPIGGHIVNGGGVLGINSLGGTQTYYATSVRGNLYFDASLKTPVSTTTNWNGIMFDIVAQDTIWIDSLATKINTLGNQNVTAYYRNGSHVGYENTSTAWQLWGVAPIQNAVAGTFQILDYSDQLLYPNDTLAIYLHLQTGGELSYLNTGTSVLYSNPELQILGGTGITHTFGTTYTPRNWAGEIFYHHGYNPDGDCATPRVPVSSIVSVPNLDLGADTTIYHTDSLILTAMGAFSTYNWNINNTTGNSIQLDGTNLQIGLNTIVLDVIDPYGCSTSDTIVVNFSLNTTLESIDNELQIQLIPNPSSGDLQLIGDISEDLVIELYTSTGVQIAVPYQPNSAVLHWGDLPKGVYFVRLKQNEQQKTQKLLLY